MDLVIVFYYILFSCCCVMEEEGNRVGLGPQPAGHQSQQRPFRSADQLPGGVVRKAWEVGQAASRCLTSFLLLLAGGQGGPALGCRCGARAGCAAALGARGCCG